MRESSNLSRIRDMMDWLIEPSDDFSSLDSLSCDGRGETVRPGRWFAFYAAEAIGDRGEGRWLSSDEWIEAVGVCG